MKAFIITIVLASMSFIASAHSGGTDSRGCHHDHRTGGYHCH